jgi:hypothetical protein
VKRDKNPAYRMYTELLSGLSRLFIVLDAPITRTKSEKAMNIGNLL